jgi:hypothetical protein
MSSDTRTRLLAAIAAARRWLDDLVTGRVTDIEAFATQEGRGARSVTMLLSLAFLAPDVVKAIVDHQMSRGIGLTQMMDLPGEWSEQRKGRCHTNLIAAARRLEGPLNLTPRLRLARSGTLRLGRRGERGGM